MICQQIVIGKIKNIFRGYHKKAPYSKDQLCFQVIFRGPKGIKFLRTYIVEKH